MFGVGFLAEPLAMSMLCNEYGTIYSEIQDGTSSVRTYVD